MSEKVDLRIRKTKANLYKGILELLKKKPLEEIKIIDICKNSGINRSTFYDHFNNIPELLESLIQDSKEEITEHLKNAPHKQTNLKEYLIFIIEEFINYMKKHTSIAKTITIIEEQNPETIYDMIFDIIEETTLEELENKYQNTSNTPNETIALFYASGITKIIMESIKDLKTWKIETVRKEWMGLLPDFNYLTKKES